MRVLCCVALIVVCLSAALATKSKCADSITWQNNVCRYFEIIDVDHDGVATYFDFLILWLHAPLTKDKFKPNLVVDIKRQIELAKEFLKSFPLCDSNFVKSLLRPITLDYLLERLCSRRFSEELKSEVKELILFFGRVCNYDGDNFHFTKNELKIVYTVLQIDIAYLERAFKAMDKDGDDQISVDEGVDFAYGFFVTGNDDETRLFAGPTTTCDAVRNLQPAATSSFDRLVSLGLNILQLAPPKK